MNRYKFIVIYSLLTKLLFWFSSSPLKFGSRVLIVKDVSLTPNLNQMEPLGEKSRVKFATVRYVFCVFTHVASIYANLLEEKKAFT